MSVRLEKVSVPVEKIDSALAFGANLITKTLFARVLVPLQAILVLAFSLGICFAETVDPGLAVKDLYEANQWKAVLELTSKDETRSPDVEYYRGMAAARLGLIGAARDAFRSGQIKAPGDKRFSLELAGLAFQENKFEEAKSHLHLALSLDRDDPYGNEFLGTVYYLEDNEEAALKYWNRVNRPLIRQVLFQPRPRLHSSLLDRALAFSPADTLLLDDYRLTKERLNDFGIFPRASLDLVSREDRDFDLVIALKERNGMGSTRVTQLVTLLRGLPYETIHPEFYNLNQSGINFISLLRFDAQKRRAYLALSAPRQSNPNIRYGVFLDARKELWDFSENFYRYSLPAGDLKLQKTAFGAEMLYRFNWRADWENALEGAYRSFDNFSQTPEQDPALYAEAWTLLYRTRFDYRLFVEPEHRVSLSSRIELETGKFITQRDDSFSQLQAGLEYRWYPLPKGDDYLTLLRFRTGKTFGAIPFDELFCLGVMKDNDLSLRAHRATRHDKKGNSPLGYSYVLWNSEVEKIVYENSFIQLRFVPFLDVGNIYDSANVFGSNEWLWDTGVIFKFRVLKRLTVGFAYTKDLRSGDNVIYPHFSM